MAREVDPTEELRADVLDQESVAALAARATGWSRVRSR